MKKIRRYDGDAEREIMPQFYKTYPGKYSYMNHTGFIRKQLSRLNRKSRIICCETYSDIYLIDGPMSANKYLIEFTNQYGVSREQYEELNNSGCMPDAMREKIQSIKKMQKREKSKYSYLFED